MQIVEVISDANVLDAQGLFTYTLEGGHRYVLYDREVGLGLQGGAITLVGGVDQRVPPYGRSSLHNHRLILFFIGKMGDALVTGSCLTAMTARYPSVCVDIVCPASVMDVFALYPHLGQLIPYPLEAKRLDDYDFYLSFEEIEAIPRGTQRPYSDVFSACLRMPRPKTHAPIVIPRDAQRRWELPATGRPRVAIHCGSADSLRSYPADLTKELIDGLCSEGLDVFLVGHRGSGDQSSIASDDLYDLRGRTPHPGDLAAVLSQMDMVITGDSFPMHLAGALRIPTIALFTTTNAVIASDYPSVEGIPSSAACSPCSAGEGSCPLGHRECIAHRDAALSPQRIIDRVVSALSVA